MPLGLERRQNTGQLHFITFSCYRRLPYLESSKSKDILEKGGWPTLPLPNKSQKLGCPILRAFAKGGM